MNVTIKMDDDLVKQARHEAVDDGLSLSAWVAKLIQDRLSKKNAQQGSLLEALGCEELADVDIEFPRDPSPMREIDFD